MTGPRRPLATLFGFEHVAMLVAVLGLGAASGVAWKTIEANGRAFTGPPSEPVWASQLVVEAAPATLEPPRALLSPVPRTRPQPVQVASAAPRPLELPKLRPRPTVTTRRAIQGEPRRVRVADANGRPTVARVHGDAGSRVVILPDGQLGWPNGMVFTDEPFRPLTADVMVRALQCGPYRHFGLVRTEHYLVFHTSTPEFARQSGQLLESLYRGLSRKFRELGLPVRDAEFPLVAVVFRNETEFREHREVASDVQACYDALSNEIFLYETKDRDNEAPQAAAMRKPQTVGHEGTHQILQNIGVQPRLAPWPTWLVEGLAEFGSATTTNRSGEWAGFGHVNPLHVATIHELEDTLALQGRDRRLTRRRVGSASARQAILDLIDRDELTPTDYALAWGLTHYLATKRCDEFVGYLKGLSTMSPLAPSTKEGRAREFRRAFGSDATGLAQQWCRYVGAMRRGEPLPYFMVVFEQPIGDGFMRRGTMVSQSPQVIREWAEGMAKGVEAPFAWRAFEYPSRSAAVAAADEWTGDR